MFYIVIGLPSVLKNGYRPKVYVGGGNLIFRTDVGCKKKIQEMHKRIAQSGIYLFFKSFASSAGILN